MYGTSQSAPGQSLPRKPHPEQLSLLTSAGWCAELERAPHAGRLRDPAGGAGGSGQWQGGCGAREHHHQPRHAVPAECVHGTGGGGHRARRGRCPRYDRHPQGCGPYRAGRRAAGAGGQNPGRAEGVAARPALRAVPGQERGDHGVSYHDPGGGSRHPRVCDRRHWWRAPRRRGQHGRERGPHGAGAHPHRGHLCGRQVGAGHPTHTGVPGDAGRLRRSVRAGGVSGVLLTQQRMHGALPGGQPSGRGGSRSGGRHAGPALRHRGGCAHP
mmetsp:Transcript_21177/g.54271  ORF Transcript_21177/g.54271 Transcript_21177/m.54271 type:complete len:270 (+) Transcript_21177:110-919(+)